MTLPREITHHRNGNVANDSLQITADERGSGNASHHYRIEGFNTASNPSDPFTARHGEPAQHSTVLFQNGPVGVNGVTQEALLAILIDRLEGFQSGPYACAENAEALGFLRTALHVLNQRTARRTMQGTEGTHTPDPQTPPAPAPATLRYFACAHLPPNLQRVSLPLRDVAQRMVDTLPACAETTAGLRKLLEAKDCFVRAALPGPSQAMQTEQSPG